jgi:NAD(P)H dehydrogenase (quinone)
MSRVLILYANPVATSFGAALHWRIVEVLRANAHEVDDCDLYAERFDPILSNEDRAIYDDPTANRKRVVSYAERVLSAEALILIYPVWNEGFPAILKGFFDRVFIPGVSFQMGANGSVKPGLGNLKKLAAVCTYGADRLTTMLLGDPPRRIVNRLLRSTAGRHVSCEYLACYNMNRCATERRVAFLAEVQRAFEAWK